MTDDKTIIRNPDPGWKLKRVGTQGDQSPISVHDEMTVGRAADADLVISGGAVSRLHATLHIANSQLLVTDNNSANGTFVNGKRVGSAPLRVGDIVSFDTEAFEVTGAGPASPDPGDQTLVRPLSGGQNESGAKRLVTRIDGSVDDAPPSAESVESVVAKTQVLTAEEAPGTAAWQAAEVAVSGTLVMEGADLAVIDKAALDNDYLLGLDEPVLDRQFRLNKARMTVGRSPLNDLIIKADSVSSHHAEIEKTREGWVIRDIGSSNGTEVNGLEGDTFTLQPGDKVRLGDVALEFRLHHQHRNSDDVAVAPTGSAWRAEMDKTRWLVMTLTVIVLGMMAVVAWVLIPPIKNGVLPGQDLFAASTSKTIRLDRTWSQKLAAPGVVSGLLLANVRDDEDIEIVVTDDQGNYSIHDYRTGRPLSVIAGGKPYYAAPALMMVNGKPSLITADVEAGVQRRNGRGQLLWHSELGAVAQGVFSAPEINTASARPLIVVATYGRGLVGLDANSGAVLWDSAAVTPFKIVLPPLSLNLGQANAVLALGAEGQLQLFNIDTDQIQLRWQSQLPGADFPVGRLRVNDKVIAIVTESGSVVAIDKATGEIIWHQQLDATVFSEPVLLKDKMFVASASGKIFVVDVLDGNVLSETAIGASVEAGLQVVGEQVLIVDTSATLHLLDAAAALVGPGALSDVDTVVRTPQLADAHPDQGTDLITVSLNGLLQRYRLSTVD